jgi:protease-4
MAREVFKTRGKKPIICSLGDVAASGGYFAAAGCDTIFADRMTITGSIGIFNGKFDLSTLLSRVGVTWQTTKRGKNADAESFLRPFTDEERFGLKRMLHYYYGRFIKAVADGRGLTTAQVDAVGRGRVWTGQQAKPIKLIDEFGGMGEAIDAAKRAAGMQKDQKAQIVMLPTEESGLLQRLLGGSLPGLGKAAGESGDRTGSTVPSLTLNDLVPGATELDLASLIPGSLWVAPTAVQARLPFALVWE